MLPGEPVDDLIAKSTGLAQDLVDLGLGDDADAVVVAPVSEVDRECDVDALP